MVHQGMPDTYDPRRLADHRGLRAKGWGEERCLGGHVARGDVQEVHHCAIMFRDEDPLMRRGESLGVELRRMRMCSRRTEGVGRSRRVEGVTFAESASIAMASAVVASYIDHKKLQCG